MNTMTAHRRDMSNKQYVKAMISHGFSQDGFGFLGYWRVPIKDQHLLVSDLNAGQNRRRKLAYMLAVLEREQAKENSQ